MDGFRRGMTLLVALICLALSGASCPQGLALFPGQVPCVLTPPTTLDQVVRTVNDNNARIQSFWTTEATLTGPGLPPLRANLAFERPRRLRLLAETGLTGPELDLGSNDELFWFWARRSEPPAIYFCRHAQFSTSPARQYLPFEPQWLVEALGVAEFDPALPHQGPFPLPGNRLEVRTIRETPEGTLTKVTVVDGCHGWVLEQQLYDAQGRLLAASQTGGHRRDPLSGLVMPTVVDFRFPPAQLALRIRLGNVQINRPLEGGAELFQLPRYEGAPLVDLGDPRWQPPPPMPPGAELDRLGASSRGAGAWRSSAVLAGRQASAALPRRY